MTTPIEYLYLTTGLILPLFYIPQLVKLAQDASQLESFSLVKAFSQLVLRLPALLFSYVIVGSPIMNIVLTTDVIGRLTECAFAVHSLRRQGLSRREIAQRLVPRNLPFKFNLPTAPATESRLP